MGRYILPELNPHLAAKPNRLITPSKAIASYLKVPHLSLETLAQTIVRRHGMGVASALLSRRLLQNAVGSVIQTKDMTGTARAFLSTIKDLLRSGDDLSKLQQNSDFRIQQLSNLAIAYQEQLRQYKRIDAAELYWQCALTSDARKSYTFYGYYAPSNGELASIDAIAGEDSILVLPSDRLYPQQRALDWLQSQGWELLPCKSQPNTGINLELQQCFKQESALPAGVSLNVFPHLTAEIRGVLARVKVLQSQGVAPQDIVLVTKEEQLYGETLIDLAWEYNLPLQLSYEISLKQTRLGAWLKLLLEVMRDNFPFEATAKLLSHPLVEQMTPELWDRARESHPQGSTEWQELGIDLSLLDVGGSYARSFWLDRLGEIISTWNILENAKAWAREIIAYYRLQSGLKELSQPAAQKLSKQAFMREIDEILALLTIPAQPGRGGIDLLSPTSLVGTNYAYVFVLGCIEGVLPKAIADDPILDFHSRKQLARQGFNITTATDLALRETWDFYCLLGVPTQSLTFSYPELIERHHSIPSPYLACMGLQPSPVDNLPLASIEQARRLYLRQPQRLPADNTLITPALTHAFQVEASRESAIVPDHYDGVIGISLDPQQKIFSASQLTQLGQCPFKWFSARLLKLKELPEAESDLSAAVRGTLYHRCLELAFEGIKTANDLAQFNREQLDRAFITAERELNLPNLPGWLAQRREHLDLLALNLAMAEFLPESREVVATETKFEMQWHDLKVRGQVDRIDRTERGLMVIDYKTSGVTPAGVKDATGKASLDIQLAVYQDAIAATYVDETIDTAAYYSLTQQKTISQPQKDPAELAAFAERVKTHLQQGYYPVAPDRDRQACRYCDYDLVCRRGDRLFRKPT